MIRRKRMSGKKREPSIEIKHFMKAKYIPQNLTFYLILLEALGSYDLNISSNEIFQCPEKWKVLPKFTL